VSLPAGLQADREHDQQAGQSDCVEEMFTVQLPEDVVALVTAIYPERRHAAPDG
jgi:hypothetical protein